MRNHLRLCILSLLFGGCVSVQLPGGKIKSAEGVQLVEPSKPFKSIKAVNADKTWLSDKTGNTISYLSDCGGTNDPSLQSLESESLSALNKLHVISSDSSNYNGREALQTVATGEIDGVAVKLHLLFFKKNGCNYTLSYGGVQKQFATELNYFEIFKEKFKAP